MSYVPNFSAVNVKNGRTPIMGDTVVDFRGEASIFLGVSRAPEGCSSGRVAVLRDGRTEHLYPSVFDLQIVPTESTRTPLARVLAAMDDLHLNSWGAAVDGQRHVLLCAGLDALRNGHPLRTALLDVRSSYLRKMYGDADSAVFSD
jgi:hypothetical protein